MTMLDVLDINELSNKQLLELYYQYHNNIKYYDEDADNNRNIWELLVDREVIIKELIHRGQEDDSLPTEDDFDNDTNPFFK